jgi:chromosome segregation ATPase
MTTPEPSEREDVETIEKEVSVLLDEVEAIINDPSESIERKKEAQTMIQRAIEKGSTTIRSKGTILEDLRKRYECITRMYYNSQIQQLKVIKDTLKTRIEQEKQSSYVTSKQLDELNRDLKECENTIELHKNLLEKLQKE